MRRVKILSAVLLLGAFVYGVYYYTQPFVPLDTSVPIDKVVVVKHKHTLEVFGGGKLLKTYKIAFGRVAGAKEYEGDKKTPEGIYTINDKNPNSGYHKNLGISYPNKKDVEYAKKLGKSPGSLIKIHGLRNRTGWIGHFHRFFDWTLGCIAVTNKEIDELYQNVKIGTPIEIKP